ncbi:hypothetical protein [uncultured Alistipes sp.]|uniref:hypothetical protein n=1 Tax=uncultured Alistipes sp. TaxID=538949 RepID=UPI0025CD0987|nr:hypothetical protein [uncultured Alistipes sp.]
MSDDVKTDFCPVCGEPLDTCSNCGHTGCTSCDPDWSKLPDWLFYCPRCKKEHATPKN